MTKRVRTHLPTVLGILALILLGAASAEKRAVAKTSTLEDLLPLTCAQAWVQAGQSYAGIVAIVKQEARVSLINRDLTFPDTRQAGQDAGRGIADDCKADPNGLLFAIVDKHVRRVALAGNDAGR